MTYGRIVCPRLGGPEVLTIAEEQLPKPAPGEVCVRVLAAGVSWADCMMRRGTYPDQPKLPFTPGYDVVGVVEQAGPGVQTLRPSQRIAALMMHGGYAEFVFLPETEAIPVPELDPAESVALVLNYTTAYQMLHHVTKSKRGETILVHSAAGGVGTALLELARHEGIQTIGTASKSKHDLLSALDCRPIDYRDTDFVAEVHRLTNGRGVDTAFDPIGGSHWLRSRKAVKRGGTLAVYGSQGAGKAADIAAGTLLTLWPGRRFAFYSITSMKRSHPERFRQDLGHLFELLGGGIIHPVIGERLPWREAARANQLLEQGSTMGKIVLTFS